jgi:hypothetical protein
MKKRVALALSTVLSTLVVSGAAWAGPVFDVTATTLLAVNNSSRMTFAPTSVLLGSIELTDAAGARIMAGMPTQFGAGDIANFQFTVGSLTLGSVGAMGVDFAATLAASGNTFSLFRLLFTTPGGMGGCDLLCVTEFGRFANARSNVNITSRSLNAMGGIALDIFGARFSFQQRQVPEPAAFGLIAFGVLAQLARSTYRRRSAH